MNAGVKLGYQRFWREGLLYKGLFPGKEFVDPVSGLTIEPAKDDNGEIITSYGPSKKASFLTYAGKLGVNYVIGGNMRVYGNVGYFNDAPNFNQVFLSPRTRNSMVDNLTTVKTFASDLNWQYSGNGINVRATVYYTTIKDQSKVMSAYDDVQNASNKLQDGTYTLDGKTFVLHAADGFYQAKSNDLYYLLIGKKDSYVELPVIEGKALTSVKFLTGPNASENVIIDLAKQDGTPGTTRTPSPTAGTCRSVSSICSTNPYG